MDRESFIMLGVQSMKENGRTIRNMGRLMNKAVLPVTVNILYMSTNLVQFKVKNNEIFLVSGS